VISCRIFMSVIMPVRPSRETPDSATLVSGA
jgi:hypothetical protein